MKSQATTREEYFSFAGDREADLRELDALIRESAPDLEPVFFGGMSGKMLGYGMMPYKTKSMKEPGEWPLIALAAQKNYTSLYVCAIDEDRKYVAEKHADQLGKVSVGKSCIRFKKLEDLDQKTFRLLLQDLNKKFISGEHLFGEKTK